MRLNHFSIHNSFDGIQKGVGWRMPVKDIFTFNHKSPSILFCGDWLKYKDDKQVQLRDIHTRCTAKIKPFDRPGITRNRILRELFY
jgi:hypothetical protein